MKSLYLLALFGLLVPALVACNTSNLGNGQIDMTPEQCAISIASADLAALECDAIREPETADPEARIQAETEAQRCERYAVAASSLLRATCASIAARDAATIADE